MKAEWQAAPVGTCDLPAVNVKGALLSYFLWNNDCQSV